LKRRLSKGFRVNGRLKRLDWRSLNKEHTKRKYKKPIGAAPHLETKAGLKRGEPIHKEGLRKDGKGKSYYRNIDGSRGTNSSLSSSC